MVVNIILRTNVIFDEHNFDKMFFDQIKHQGSELIIGHLIQWLFDEMKKGGTEKSKKN
jgi:hypothetical protein